MGFREYYWLHRTILLCSEDYQDIFDIILVDAPCSGEGMFRSKIAVDEWSVENTSHCSERQKRILMDVWPALKENGILIYSTCTFNPGENEENIKWLTAKQEAECIRIDISGFNGITEIDFHGIYGYGFYPDKVKGEGFFISVVRKKSKQEKTIIRSQRKAELKPDKNDYEIADKWTGFSNDRLLKWEDELFAVPCVWRIIFTFFRISMWLKPGTKLFVSRKIIIFLLMSLQFPEWFEKMLSPHRKQVIRKQLRIFVVIVLHLKMFRRAGIF